MRTKVKKLTSVILAVVMMLGILTIAPLTVSAATYGDFEYTLEDDYTCTITGYNGSAANVTIPSEIDGYKVLKIGGYCFYNCKSLTSVTIPNSVKKIAPNAFRDCISLKTVSIGNNLEDYDAYEWYGSYCFVFKNCEALESITVSSSNNNYSSVNGVMYDKMKTEILLYPEGKKDTTYTVPSTIKTLYKNIINNNPYLKTITIPASVTDIRDYAVGYTEVALNYYKVSGFTIKGYKGTAAEEYAKENGFKFIALDVSEPTSVSLNKTSLTLDVGKSYTLTKTVSPSNAVTSYTWSSSNTSVATVDKNGKVTAKASGTATITVKTSNGKAANCKVTVNLPAPQITGLANTTGGIKISWNKVDGAYGYRLYYKPASGGWKRFKDTTATSFTDSGVVPNKTETYTIRCIDKNGKTVSGFNSKGWSKKYTATTPKITKLTNTSKGVSVTWNKIAGVYGYRLYQKTSNGWKRIKDTTATSYTDSAVSANQTKTYTIRCIDKNGKTVSGFNSKGWSKKYTAATPKITKLTNRSKGVSVTWNKIAGVYGYRLYRKYDGGSWTKVKDTTSTSFTDSGAKKGKKVTYTVRCIDRKGKTVSGFNSKGWSITRK